MKFKFKRYWVLLVSLLALLVITGCGAKKTANNDNKGYDTAISIGLSAVAEDDMDKAVTYFETALDQKAKDKKATVYLKQAQGYLNVKKDVKNGELKKAKDKISSLVKIKNGSAALSRKLKALKKDVSAKYKEYTAVEKQLHDLEAALKAKNYTQAKPIAEALNKIDWDKKTYLKKLQTKVKQSTDAYDKAAAVASSSTATKSANSSSDKATSKATNSKDHADAEFMRKLIADSGLGYTVAQLEKIPDSAILAATNKSDAAGGDPSYTGSLLADQYPNILTSSDSDSGSIDDADKEICENMRQKMIDDGYNADDINNIPDSLIMKAMAGVGNATNSDLAQSEENVRKLAGLPAPDPEY
ncbi:hypothetical protein [Lacticaseibacillus hulanensis]|uniref:hypothetical protein n=1 Tax=Lacticaseibacillus hulanensis TaxID=2493111 RepID=UPI000FD8E887|nr:hypothetical protein [Lacticaseibacillus hulanensis]